MEGFVGKKIALLCDYGLDDAAATALLLENIDKFERIDIVPIAGNMPLSVCQNNAMRILYQMKPPIDKVCIVDTGDIVQPFDNLASIHGEDGTGCVMPPEYEPTPMQPFEKWLETLDDSYVLVSLGPCTVTRIILEKAGNIPLLLMGGNIEQTPNCNGYEFNHALDLEAFAFCTACPHVIATMDSCHNSHCNFYLFDAIDERWSTRFSRRSAEYSQQRKEPGAYIYDRVAVTFLLHPDRFFVSERIDKDGNRLSVLNYCSDKPIWQE